VGAISFDVPAGGRTTFLGKPAHVARGPVGLAMATGAQVITDRRGLRRFAKLNEPIDPSRFASVRCAHAPPRGRFTQELLRRPEALNADPALAGVWSDAIGSDVWAFL